MVSDNCGRWSDLLSMRARASEPAVDADSGRKNGDGSLERAGEISPSPTGCTGFRAVVEASTAPLTESDQRIIGVLLAVPHECVFLSAAQVAERASVNESTVIRLAQKLGYAGYRGLRADLGVDVRQLSENANGRWMESAATYGLARLVQEQIRVLSQMPDYVTQESVEAAAAALLSARRIFLFGQDYARTLVEFMDRRLRCFGFDIVAMRYAGDDLAEHLVSFREDDVLLAFAFKEQRGRLAEVLRHPHVERGVSILVTEHPGVVLRPAPTHLLAAPRGLDQDRNTLVVPLTLCYALESALLQLAPEKVGDALQRLKSLAGPNGGNGKRFAALSRDLSARSRKDEA
jgi:DNA-binding MurR/RpiR family transcriptional regulator